MKSESLLQIAKLYETDKSASKKYIDVYERLFSGRRKQKTSLLELGVHRGGSLQMWRDYFVNGLIVGVDLSIPDKDFGERVKMFESSQDDSERLNGVLDVIAPDGLDIIIDDASHLGDISRLSLINLFPRLKSGGFYILEDWGTGYWESWPDGAQYHPPVRFQGQTQSHSHGMVGLVKELVDHAARTDITAGSADFLEIESLEIHMGMVVIRKE